MHNMVHDGIYLHNWGYFGEGPSLQTCTANISAWSSGYKALIEGVFINKFVAFQEHKLVTKIALDMAFGQASHYGFRTERSLGLKTAKGGCSSGVGFMWPRHGMVQNPGRLFIEAKVYSIEVPHEVFGIITLVSFYGVSGDTENTYANLSRVIQALDKTRCPYIICGAFNIKKMA